MALSTFKCSYLMPLHFEVLDKIVFGNSVVDYWNGLLDGCINCSRR